MAAEETHIYFMAPLKCSETQMRASTLCLRSVSPRSIAGCGGGAATCPDCIKRMGSMLADYQRLIDSSKDERVAEELRQLRQQLQDLKG